MRSTFGRISAGQRLGVLFLPHSPSVNGQRWLSKRYSMQICAVALTADLFMAAKLEEHFRGT